MTDTSGTNSKTWILGADQIAAYERDGAIVGAPRLPQLWPAPFPTSL